LVCAKWRHPVDFDIITILAIWQTEGNGSSESTTAMRSSRLKSPSDSGMMGVSFSFVDMTNIRTYFPTVEELIVFSPSMRLILWLMASSLYFAL
jgi:hypothetical protein